MALARIFTAIRSRITRGMPIKPLQEWLLRHLFSIVLIFAIAFLYLWWHHEAARPYLVPIGTAAGAFLGALPGLISEHRRGKWAYAMLGSAFVGLVTWYSTLDLEHKVEDARHDLGVAMNDLSVLRARHNFMRSDLEQYARNLGKPLLIKVAAILESAWQTDVLSRPVGRDYTHVDDLTAFLLRLDSNNGHGLYYSGSAKRARGTIGARYEDFERYLTFEKSLPENERDGYRPVCYERAKGYCRERTAYIQQLLANDYAERGYAEANPINRRADLVIALRYCNGALDNLKLLPQIPEFNSDGQGTPTQQLKRSLEKELSRQP